MVDWHCICAKLTLSLIKVFINIFFGVDMYGKNFALFVSLVNGNNNFKILITFSVIHLYQHMIFTQLPNILVNWLRLTLHLETILTIRKSNP